MLQLKSIKTKLSLSFGALLIIICVGLGVVSYMTSANALVSIIDESLSQLAKEASKVVQERVNTQLNALEALAEIDAIKGNSLTLDEKLKLLDKEVERSGHYKIIIADTNGNAKDNDGGSSNISDREYFKKALSGERAVSDPVVSKVDNSLIVAFAVPIKDGNAVKGALIALRDGDELSAITNDIKFGKDSYAILVNGEGTTIANPDKNLVMEMYNYIEAAKNDSELRELAGLIRQMIEGKEGVGEYKYKGLAKYMGFAPVEGTSWSLAITSPKSEIMAKVNSLAVTMVIISIVFLGVSILIVLLIASGISKPIKTASDYLSVVATGDFTKEVPKGLLKMKDETGVLANAIGTMQQSIRKILKEVVDESSNASQMLININTEMERLNKSIEEISATTQELSAGTEETAASTEEMNATSTEIEKAVESIADKAQEGAVTVKNVHKMAEEMKQNAVTSRGNTIGIYGKTKNSLQNAIEQSKAVDQINELSAAILAITSQTNLLALNAAIEAARAGEAGKGFAVVAEEIRKLAESSKNTVTRIQEVTKVILEAVNNLSASSSEILEFIDKQVLNDYEYLVKASEQYSQESSNINDMVTDFSATSEELLASVQNMVKAINEIASASNEEAQGAANIAQEASAIMQMVDNVVKLAESAKERSNLLIKAVSHFKV